MSGQHRPTAAKSTSTDALSQKPKGYFKEEVRGSFVLNLANRPTKTGIGKGFLRKVTAQHTVTTRKLGAEEERGPPTRRAAGVDSDVRVLQDQC